MSNDIDIIHNYYNLLVYYVYKYCLFYMCNITLTRRRGSRPDGARIILLSNPTSGMTLSGKGSISCHPHPEPPSLALRNHPTPS